MKKILIIDDDKLVIKSLRRLLEQEGYIVSCAENSSVALDLAEQIDFDLIISDIRMPGVDGITTVKKIKQISEEQNKKAAPIIFITGYSDSQSDTMAKAVNPADFIYKPFDKDKFLQSIETAIRDT